MNVMATHPPNAHRSPVAAAVMVVGAMLISACGSTAQSATTDAPTTTAATTTTSTTTTTTTTTTTLPTPIPVPVDEYGDEPIVEFGRIEIPAIGVDSPLYQGIRLTTLDVGPGHWPGSAEPGRLGNAVVAGHRTSHNRVFRNIDRLEAGDEIIYHMPDGVHVYAVRDVLVVTPESLWIIESSPEAITTLFACHPPGSVSERIVVFADLVSDLVESDETVAGADIELDPWLDADDDVPTSDTSAAEARVDID